MKTKTKNEEVHNYRVSINILKRKGKPAIEIRTLATDPKVIKIIVARALANMPITVFPTFRDNLRAVASLIEKGILKYNAEKNEYKFVLENEK